MEVDEAVHARARQLVVLDELVVGPVVVVEEADEVEELVEVHHDVH